ncbi:MAG: serine hydrolase domain-containing protein [Candidatus Hodarchaeota archaeon]
MKNNHPYEALIERIKSEIPRKMQEQNIPGLAISIINKKGPIWTEGFGYTDMTKRRKVDVNTIFSLQSTTKSVTTVGMLLAVQKGLVNLEDSIKQFYPEFTVLSRYGEDQENKITIRHLLSHSSGLTFEHKLGGVFDNTPCSWEEHIQSISGSWLLFPVGSAEHYSNAGMDLSAYLIERITGQKYVEYIQKEIGDTLGITFYYNIEQVRKQENSVRGYLGQYEAAPTDDLGLGCGVAYLSIKDLAIFARMLLNLGKIDGKDFLKSELVEEMRNATLDGGYGLGTTVEKQFGTSLPNHAGGGFGLTSEMFWVPDHDIGIVVMTNQEYQGYSRELTYKVLSTILEQKGVSTASTKFPYSDKEEIKLNTEKLERFVGRYLASTSNMKLNLKEGKLVLGMAEQELIPVSETAFKIKGGEGVRFQLDEQGKPVSMKWYTNSHGVIDLLFFGKPHEKPGPNKREWKQFEGLYRTSLYSKEVIYDAIKLEKDGYLHFLNSGDVLYEYEGDPKTFFTIIGEAVVFGKGYVYNGNAKSTRVDDIVSEITALAEKEPKHRHLQGWILEQIVNGLIYLNRNKEAKKINHIKKKVLE